MIWLFWLASVLAVGLGPVQFEKAHIRRLESACSCSCGFVRGDWPKAADALLEPPEAVEYAPLFQGGSIVCASPARRAILQQWILEHQR